jgi:hypothetical protein
MAEAHSDAAAPAGGPAESADRSRHPPRPRFALTIGIVGHRLDFWWDGGQLQRQRLQAVTDNVRAALHAVNAAAQRAYESHKQLFDDTLDPQLTLVSALASGADTIAAKAALDLGYGLDAPLAFPPAEYEDDFRKITEVIDGRTALEQFQELIRRARSLTLPGQRRLDTDSDEQGALRENRAYEAAGLTVLSQADILLAVWDHALTRGRGGTADMVAEAARVGLPIILVDAKGEKPVELRWRGLRRTPAPIVTFDDLPRASLDACMDCVIDELVRAPQAPEQRQGLERWYAEISRGVNFAMPFSMLMRALFVRRMRRGDMFPSQPSELAGDYVKSANPAVDPQEPELIAHLAEPYGWADAVGIYCAQFFRSAFVINFVFAAFAVIAASASVMMMDEDRWWRHVPVAVEIALIFCVVANTLLVWRVRWHPRWVEARELAERFRVALPLWTLGLRPAFFPGEEQTWTGWYTRAMVRMQGLRSADLSTNNLAGERSVLLNLLKDQRGYNHANAGRMRRMERRLEVIGLCLLVATLAVAVDHLRDGPVAATVVGALNHLVDKLCVARAPGRWLNSHEVTIWLSAALPALATASYGIRIIGDFEGIHQRGERTYRQLLKLSAATKRDADLPLDEEETAQEKEEEAASQRCGAMPKASAVEQDSIAFALLRARTSTAAEAMLGDVASWRLSAESRGLAIPG